MEETGIRLLWGTANLVGHLRYMTRAATNPDLEVFKCAAAQVRCMPETTHDLRGANYVLWGGREGYGTLLDTNLRQELDQLGRFLAVGRARQTIDGLGPRSLQPGRWLRRCFHQAGFRLCCLPLWRVDALRCTLPLSR
jgi:xylose isomerase